MNEHKHFSFPSPAFLPLGWYIAGLAEISKHAMTVVQTAEALKQLTTSLAFIALDKK